MQCQHSTRNQVDGMQILYACFIHSDIIKLINSLIFILLDPIRLLSNDDDDDDDVEPTIWIGEREKWMEQLFRCAGYDALGILLSSSNCWKLKRNKLTKRIMYPLIWAEVAPFIVIPYDSAIFTIKCFLITSVADEYYMKAGEKLYKSSHPAPYLYAVRTSSSHAHLIGIAQLYNAYIYVCTICSCFYARY